MNKACLGIAILCFLTTDIFAQWSSGRPDGHAPIHIMGDHTHAKGEIMLSYRYMVMNMDGNMDGTSELSSSELLRPDGPYMAAPETMPMQMHMLGMMYAVSNDLTMMIMLPYAQASMDHLMANGNTFTTESSGLGDIKLSGLYTFVRTGRSQAHAHLGVGIPSGSIEKKDDTPMADNALLPYPMQIGSGSWEFLPGFTFLTQNDMISAGLQTRAKVRLTDNENNYRFGNHYEASAWAGYKINKWVSPEITLQYLNWEDIQGRDPRYDMALFGNVVHTVDPDLKSGSRVDLGIGLNISIPEGIFHDLRIAGNYNLSVYQNLDGPQMKTAGILTLGLQYTIH